MARQTKNTTLFSPKGCYLRRFTLKNVRTFRSPVTLDFCHPNGKVAQWMVVLGENGTGKTTLLQYLAGMMPTDKIDPRPPHQESAYFGPTIANLSWQSWHSANLARSQSGLITVEAELKVSEPSTTLGSPESAIDAKAGIGLHVGFLIKSEDVSLTNWGGWSEKTAQIQEHLRLFVYGASRHVASAASPYLTSETFFKNGGSEPTSTLFHDDYPLISPEQWLLGLDHTSRSTGNVAKAAKRSYESAKRCFVNTLPGVTEIDVKQQKGGKGLPAMALMCRTSYGEVPFSALSLGYRTMAAWLIDFVKRMHEAFPDLEEPDDGPAIVLVDEFDLHMHPKWQREAMTALSKEFPNTQFIVTAHSPLIVQAAGGDAKIVVLRRRPCKDGGEEVIVEDHPHSTDGWRVDQILEALYGVSPRSPRYEELMRERVKLRQREKLTAAEARKLAKTEAELDQLEPADEVSASQRLLSDLKNALEAASGTSRRQRKA
jgi:energy-coupling factor transporter ATP-binding protein EcfA2